MKKISIILLSAVLVFSMAACNGGKEKADNQTEKQTESVKPTEEVSITAEVDTEATTEVVSEVTSEPLTETEEPAEKDNPSDKKSTDQQKTSNQEAQPKQNEQSEQKATVGDNDNSAGNQNDSGQGNNNSSQTTSVAYSPQNIVSLATAKCQAGGMITTQQNLQNHLNDGSITQEEYNEYYPYDGMEGSYYSVFVETDLNKAMAIYQEDEYKEVIRRVKQKIAELKIEIGATLSEEEISRFEKQCHIRLPEAYRLFLQEVGDGCDDMLDGFQLNRLSDIEKRNLSSPFLLEEEWIWEADDRPQSVINEEMETKVYQGELELIDTGCCTSYNLIVTGKCRGEVWSFSDVGVQPCCERQDFLGWFELWLDCQDETDYFKDYV